jgi:Adenylate and Guanylate cyclase catalytic domain
VEIAAGSKDPFGISSECSVPLPDYIPARRPALAATDISCYGMNEGESKFGSCKQALHNSSLRVSSPTQPIHSDTSRAYQKHQPSYGLRLGINLGDIIIDGDVIGDGVNVAARLEEIAEPGGVCLSGSVHEQVAGKIGRSFENRGEQHVKNISRPIRVSALAG